MSTIRKVPFIEKVIGRLSDENIATLKSVMNSYSTNTDKSLYTSGKFITTADKGIFGVNLELELGLIRTGILIYTDYVESDVSKTQCVLLSYNRFQEMQIYEIESDLRHYHKVNEELTIEELRRVMIEGSNGDSDEWVETMKNVMIYDSEENEVQVGTHLYIDGDLETGGDGQVGDIVVGHDLIIDSIANIQDPDGKPLLAPSLDADDGTYVLKCVKSGTGFTFTFVKETTE